MTSFEELAYLRDRSNRNARRAQQADDRLRRTQEQLEAAEAAFREATLGFISYAFPEDDPEKIIEDVMSGFRQSGQLRRIASNLTKASLNLTKEEE